MSLIRRHEHGGVVIGMESLGYDAYEVYVMPSGSIAVHCITHASHGTAVTMALHKVIGCYLNGDDPLDEEEGGRAGTTRPTHTG